MRIYRHRSEDRTLATVQAPARTACKWRRKRYASMNITLSGNLAKLCSKLAAKNDPELGKIARCFNIVQPYICSMAVAVLTGLL